MLFLGSFPPHAGSRRANLGVAGLRGNGKKTIIYFYPKDNTSGCAAEACSFRDNYAELTAAGYNVVGVGEYCRRMSSAIGRPVGTGVFGADMKVSLTNDGPVTICIDSRNR